MFDGGSGGGVGCEDELLLVLWGGVISFSSWVTCSTTQNFVRRATVNICLQAEWFLVKKIHVHLLTVQSLWNCPSVTLT